MSFQLQRNDATVFSWGNRTMSAKSPFSDTKMASRLCAFAKTMPIGRIVRHDVA